MTDKRERRTEFQYTMFVEEKIIRPHIAVSDMMFLQILKRKKNLDRAHERVSKREAK